MQEEGSGFLRNTNEQRTMSCPLLLLFLPRISQHLDWRWRQRRNWKDRANDTCFSFQFFLTHQEARGLDWWENVCMSWKEIETVELVFCSISTVWGRTKWTTNYELWNSGDPAYKLHTLTLAFKTGIAHIKKNGEIQAKNEKFSFFFIMVT